MKYLFDEVSVQCSQNVTNTYSTSFSIAVRLLSPKIRESIYAVYGFVRLADEIVDSFDGYDKESLLNELETDVNTAIKRRISLNPILNSFQKAIHKYNIDLEYINTFLQSMKTDLSKNKYCEYSDYTKYIYGSADVVGLMCLKIFVQGDTNKFEQLKHTAMKLGSAFQKINFLRDIKEDLEILNRSYFPHLKNNRIDNTTKAMIISEIKKEMNTAYDGIRLLPIEARLGVYTSFIYYKHLLRKLTKANIEEINQARIRLSNPAKLGLLATSFVKFKLNLL
jgi:15-cis-phytoene synthase